MRPIAALLVIVVLAACGADDVVEGPFIESWELRDRLVLSVFDHEGTAEASCVIFPYDDHGAHMSLSSVEDLLPETAYHEVYVTGPFTITGGEVIEFEVDLPEVADPGFWRWQVVCDPGAPG